MISDKAKLYVEMINEWDHLQSPFIESARDEYGVNFDDEEENKYVMDAMDAWLNRNAVRVLEEEEEQREPPLQARLRELQTMYENAFGQDPKERQITVQNILLLRIAEALESNA